MISVFVFLQSLAYFQSFFVQTCSAFPQPYTNCFFLASWSFNNKARTKHFATHVCPSVCLNVRPSVHLCIQPSQSIITTHWSGTLWAVELGGFHSILDMIVMDFWISFSLPKAFFAFQTAFVHNLYKSINGSEWGEGQTKCRNQYPFP